jgi:hypothetical protein
MASAMPIAVIKSIVRIRNYKKNSGWHRQKDKRQKGLGPTPAN